MLNRQHRIKTEPTEVYMKMHPIEVDDLILDFLKVNAVPFSDTPNSVLHKLLFGDRGAAQGTSFLKSRTNARIPRALSQTLDVIYEVIKNRQIRQQATRLVAARNGTATQTIIDKYCRQLGKTASEIDHLLQEPSLDSMQTILKKKYSSHENIINDFFDNLVEERAERPFSQHESFLLKTKTSVSDDDNLMGNDKMYGFKELALIDLGKGTNPKRFRFDGEAFVINSWAELFVTIVQKLFEKGHLKLSHIPIYSYSSRREKYLINDKPKHKYPEKDAIWRQVGPLFVDVKYNANAHFKNISHLFNHLQLGHIDFGITFK